MATPAEPEALTPAPAPPARGANPLLVVAGTLLAVVVVTFGIYSIGDYEGESGLLAGGGPGSASGPAAVGACGQGTPADGSYTVDYTATPNPPRPEGTTFLLNVRRDGRAVAGAKVCITAEMPEMQHPGLTGVAKDASGGRYEVRLQFGMGGSWRMAVTVAEPDKPVVSLPLTIDVAQVEGS